MLRSTSNMLMQNGIMPYDIHSHIYGVKNPDMGYTPIAYYNQPFPMVPQGVQQTPPRKKHTLAKAAVALGVVAGAVMAVKNPEKAKGLYTKTIDQAKNGFKTVKTKGGEFFANIREKAPKFFADVKAGAQEIINKIFKKADK